MHSLTYLERPVFGAIGRRGKNNGTSIPTQSTVVCASGAGKMQSDVVVDSIHVTSRRVMSGWRTPRDT